MIDPPGAPQVLCGFGAATEHTLAPKDPCKSGRVIAGPFTFSRTTGKPNQYHETFVLQHRSRLCVRVSNVAAEHGRIASAQLHLDGVEVVAPSDLNQKVLEIEKAHPPDPGGSVGSGEHSLDARVASDPGGSLEVEVRFVRVFSETESAAVAELGTLQQLACEQFNERLSFEDPTLGNQGIETAIKLGFVPGQMAVRLNAYGVPRLLDPLPSEDFGQTDTDAPETVARKWLEHHRPLLRWTHLEVELADDYSKPSRHGTTHVRFKERIAGLPVDNGQLELVVRGRQVQRLVGHFVPEPPATMVPTLGPEAAAESALASESASPGAQVSGEPVLVVIDTGTEEDRPGAALAWRVKLIAGSSGVPRTTLVWVDALSGKVLDSGRLDYAAPTLAAYQKTSHLVGMPEECVEDPVKVVYDPKAGTDLGCHQLPEFQWCQNFSRGVTLLDLQWRQGFGRLGWSNMGIPAPPSDPGGPSLPADDAYRGVLDYTCDWRDKGGGQWLTPLAGASYFGGALLLPGPGLVLGPIAVGHGLPSGWSWSADVLRHELGHGLLQAELGERGDEGLSDLSFVRQLHEHAGDFWALACKQPECGEQFTIETALIPGVKGTEDHSILECSSHAVGGTLAPGDCPWPCEEFIHRNFWVDWVLDSASRNADLFTHRYACVLDAVAYRALEEQTITAHGVSSKGLGYSAAQHVFYEVFTNSNLNDDIFTWEHNYRNAVGGLAYKCSPFGPGGSPCRTDRDAAADGMDPYWGVGFWSQPSNLSAMGTVPMIQSSKDPAVATLKGEVFLFFVTREENQPAPVTHVFMARFSDPLDPSKQPTVQELPGTLPDTTNVVGIAAAANAAVAGQEKVSLAYITSDPLKPNIRIAHYDLAAGTWTTDASSDLAAASSLPDRPALTYVGNQWLLAYPAKPFFSGQLAFVAQNGATADGASCAWPVAPAGVAKPFLLSPHYGVASGGILFYQELNTPWGRRVSINLGSMKVECGPPRKLHQLDPRSEMPFGQPRKEVDTDHSFEPGIGGLSAAFFAGRLQVFMPKKDPQQLNRSLRQLSLGVTTSASEIYQPGSETRLVAVVEGAAAQAGGIPIAFSHPVQGDILLLYRRGGPGSPDERAIFVSYKKSD